MDEKLQELKELLDSGKITQEEYEKRKAEIEAQNGGGGGSPQLTPELEEFLKKQIQSETDKVRTELYKKIKAKEEEANQLKTKLEELETAKMSAEQRAEYERQKREQELKQKEAEIQKREIALHTVDKLKELELPLEFRDFLAGESIEDTDQRITAFQKAWNDAIQKAVDERFKQAGGQPNQGGGGSTTTNPWMPGQINLTEQGRILRENPELAAKLKAQAEAAKKKK